jgi:hypothetical protein
LVAASRKKAAELKAATAAKLARLQTGFDN